MNDVDQVALVKAALSTIQDPDLHKDLVSLNMVRDLAVNAGIASFRLVLTTGACPVKQQLEDDCRKAALTVAGVIRVDIAVSAEVPAGHGANRLPGIRNVIGIGSGKGGVGKSTVTVNLACALANMGARVGLLDADIHGPSVPVMMGIQRQPETRNKRLIPPVVFGVRLMSMGFLLEERQAVIWRGPMLVGAIRQFLHDVEWGELDYLLVDLPPGTGDVQLTLAQNAPMTGAVIVSTPQAVALADARRAASMFQRLNVPLLGLVENMSEFVCPACGHVEPIFGRGGAETEAQVLGAPFLGRVPLEPRIRIGGDHGMPVVISHPDSLSGSALTQIAARLAARVSVAALTTDNTIAANVASSENPVKPG